ncbi:MAG: hypothetical protein C4562_00195 [Actinobacteria bacterium]|nr:MAG: hypothetical protein C4562_00195 [Actinomycetota bacterium]
MFTSKNQTKTIVIFLVLLTLIKGVLFAVVVPTLEIPDENRYIENIKLLADHKLPYFEVESATGHPVLFEVIALPFFSIANSINEESGLLAVRFLGILLLCITVWLSYLSAIEIFPSDNFMHILVPLLITLNPQVTFITAAVNSDGLLILLFSAFIYFILRIIMGKISLLNLAAITLILAAGFLTKERFAVAIPILIITLIYKLIKASSQENSKVRILFNKFAIGAYGLAAVILISIFWSKIADYFSKAFIFVKYELTAPHVFLSQMFTQFWGDFAWLQNRLPDNIYLALAIFCLLAFIVLALVFLFAKKAYFDKSQQFVLTILLLCIIFTSIVIYVYQLRGASAQGRYFFIVITPITILFALGLKPLLHKFQKTGLSAVFLALSALNIYSLLWVIFPFHY